MRARVYVSGILALMLVWVVGTSGCAPRVPKRDASISGTIVSLSPTDDGGSVSVEAPAPSAAGYDKAWVRITRDTTLLRQTSGDPATIEFADLAVGQHVDVWFTGAVAESYPVQATADVVLARD